MKDSWLVLKEQNECDVNPIKGQTKQSIQEFFKTLLYINVKFNLFPRSSNSCENLDQERSENFLEF